MPGNFVWSILHLIFYCLAVVSGAADEHEWASVALVVLEELGYFWHLVEVEGKEAAHINGVLQFAKVFKLKGLELRF